MKVAVIGAGPAGLVTLRYLSTAHHFFPIDPIEVICIEAEADLGGTFKYRVYEDAEVRQRPFSSPDSTQSILPSLLRDANAFRQLVSSKYLTAFSDHRFDRSLPDFVTPGDMCDYLYTYASKFGLFQYICFDTKVVQVNRHEGGHALTLLDSGGRESEVICDAIAVCSGLHVIPDIPRIEGIERVPLVLHSSELKSRSQFGVDTNVVVLGAGETAMDIAYLAITAETKSVTICHRDGFFCGPKVSLKGPVFSQTSN